MAKKRKSDNEIIDEVLAQAAPAVEVESLPEEVIDEIIAAPVIEVSENKVPGLYYQGVRVLRTVTNLGRKWNVILVDGRRLKVNKSDLHLVK